MDELLDEFVRGLHETLVESNKTPVVWEELVLKHDLSLAKETVVMVWIDSVRPALLRDGPELIVSTSRQTCVRLRTKVTALSTLRASPLSSSHMLCSRLLCRSHYFYLDCSSDLPLALLAQLSSSCRWSRRLAWSLRQRHVVVRVRLAQTATHDRPLIDRLYSPFKTWSKVRFAVLRRMR